MATSTLFVNQTRDIVKMKLGNSHSSAPIASIAGGGQFRMHVNMNDTYREFLVGVAGSDAANSKTVIVSSDDCCDYQCITIKEVMADGTLHLLREPRQQQQLHTSDTVKKSASWFTWKMWL